MLGVAGKGSQPETSVAVQVSSKAIPSCLVGDKPVRMGGYQYQSSQKRTRLGSG